MLTIMLWEQDLGYRIMNNESDFEHTDEKKTQSILDYGYKGCNSQC